MKKVLFFLIFLSTILFASTVDIERKIYGEILHTVFPNKEVVYVWSDNQISSLTGIEGVKVVRDLESADIVILKNHLQDEQIKTKVVFVKNYYLLKEYKDFAIGGFYWQKGRPNILFLEKNLQKFNIKLSNGLENFIEDEL